MWLCSANGRLADHIESLPKADDESALEGGTGLSVGQKQWTSFARALSHERRFLLLGQSASSADSDIERKIRDTPSKLFVGGTSIVIAHRLSAIR